MTVKTVAAINDLSGVGRCSLTVAMPILSAMGAQVCPAPTAVLSAHTGFPDIAVRDMTDFLESTLAAWGRMGMTFDAVYTGYLGSPRQADAILRFLRAQTAALKVVDPVMGDEGRLYSGIDAAMVDAMRALCRVADVVTPNLTEYACLAGEEYSAHARTRGEIEKMLHALHARSVVITSVPFEDGLVNAYRARDGQTGVLRFERVDRHYPGTGDMFASVLTGSLLKGDALDRAVTRAAAYVRRTIAQSAGVPCDPNFGAQLEQTLPLLLEDAL